MVQPQCTLWTDEKHLVWWSSDDFGTHPKCPEQIGLCNPATANEEHPFLAGWENRGDRMISY